MTIGADEDRPDGHRNHGFKLLKGNPHDIESIPEAQDSPVLKKALTKLNRDQSSFFTVGCEKSCNKKDDNGYWMRGYLELAFNSVELVADAKNYFVLFFKFNETIHDRERTVQPTIPVHYHFELEGAHFLNSNSDGFTLAVWITTAMAPTDEAAKNVWGEAVDQLVDHLTGLRVRLSTPIY